MQPRPQNNKSSDLHITFYATTQNIRVIQNRDTDMDFEDRSTKIPMPVPILQPLSHEAAPSELTGFFHVNGLSYISFFCTSLKWNAQFRRVARSTQPNAKQSLFTLVGVRYIQQSKSYFRVRDCTHASHITIQRGVFDPPEQERQYLDFRSFRRIKVDGLKFPKLAAIQSVSYIVLREVSNGTPRHSIRDDGGRVDDLSNCVTRANATMSSVVDPSCRR